MAYINEEDFVRFLSARPKFNQDPLSTTPPSASIDMEQEEAPIQEGIPRLTPEDTSTEQSGFPEYKTALGEIWNGFRQGGASVADSMDSLASLVSKATGLQKGEAFAKLRDKFNPRPEEVANQNFSAALLRAIGAAVPIIAEFAVGTKGAGMAMKAAKIPQVVNIGKAAIATPPIAAFAGLEGATTAGKGGTEEEVLKATGKGAVMGTALGAAGLLGPIAHAPATAGIFGGMAALEGADAQEIAVQSLVGLGFGVHGAWKTAKNIASMKTYLEKNGYDPAKIAKLNPRILREEFNKVRRVKLKEVILNNVETKENPEEFYKFVETAKDEQLESMAEEARKVGNVQQVEKIKQINQEFSDTPEKVIAESTKEYTDWLSERGFDPEKLKNVPNRNLAKIARTDPVPEHWSIDPVSGEIKPVSPSKRKGKKSQEEIDKDLTSHNKKDIEKAQAENARKDSKADQIIKKILEDTEANKGQEIKPGASTEEVEIKQKIQHAAMELLEDASVAEKDFVTLDTFQKIGTRYGIPVERWNELQDALKENGVKVVKPDQVTDADMQAYAEKVASGESKAVVEDAERLPLSVAWAIKEKHRNLMTIELWNVLSDPQKTAAVSMLDKIMNKYKALQKSTDITKERREEGITRGRYPDGFLNAAHRRKYNSDIRRITNSLRSFMRKNKLSTTTAGKNLFKNIPKEELETPVRGKAKPAKVKPPKTPFLTLTAKRVGNLRDLGWTQEQINSLTDVNDVKRILKKGQELTPDDATIDEYGKLHPIGEKIANERIVDILRLLEKDPATTDEVLTAMSYTKEEINSAREMSPVMETSSATETETITDAFSGIGKTITGNLYDQIFDALKKGKDTVAGIKDPALAFAKPFYEKGFIKSAEDLKKLIAEKYGKNKEVSTEPEIETPVKKGRVSAKGKEKEQLDKASKGIVADLETANRIYELYQSLKSDQSVKKSISRSTTGIDGTIEKAGAIPGMVKSREAEQIVELKRMLEAFIGKKNLTDAQIEAELDKLIPKGEASTEVIPEVKEETKPTKPRKGKSAASPYDLLSEENKEALGEMGWSEGTLRNVKNPALFRSMLDPKNPLDPDVISINADGKVTIVNVQGPEPGKKASKEYKLAERMLREAEKTIPSEEDEVVLGPDTEINIKPTDTGEVIPDELIAKAYDKARKRTASDITLEAYRKAESDLRETNNELADISLALLDANLDPKMRDMLSRSQVVLMGEYPKLISTLEAFRKTYEDISSAESPKQEFAGPKPGEIKIEKSITLGDGSGGTVISEGGHGVDRFYLTQTAEGAPVPADSVGNRIAIDARVIKNDAKPKELELSVWRKAEGLNPALEDDLLSLIIEKYAPVGKDKLRRVVHVPGTADEAWQRRFSEERDRKSVSNESIETSTKKNLEDNIRTDRYISWVSRTASAIKRWKEGYSDEKKRDLYESISNLRQSSDPQQFDPENFKADIFPEYERMLGLIELFGDPTNSKIPIIRAVAQDASKAELSVQYLVNQYQKKLKAMQGPLLEKVGDKMVEFVDHLQGRKTSTDPVILEAARNERMFNEDFAFVFKAKEKGWYMDKEYSTIRYDMNKLWDQLSAPFKLATNYAELPDRIKNVMNSDAFHTAQELTRKYKDWDSMPQPHKEWIQREIFNFNGVWSNWVFLPEFLQRQIPKKVFAAYMQQRTAGEAYKAALDYDYFDLKNAYITTMIRSSVMNDLVQKWRPTINRLPGSSKLSVRRYLDNYLKGVTGSKPMGLDAWWNSLANRINTSMEANIVPLYAPSTVAREYTPMLYRGLLGPDTALRNLTQVIYTMANVGPKNTFKGFLRYVDERRRNTEEYRKMANLINIPDEFMEIRYPAEKSEGKRTVRDKVGYINHKLTRAALWPMKVTENVNKGIAYFAGLEEAMAKGYDLNVAHIVGVDKASRIAPMLEMTDGQYRAIRTMYESQFGYTASHTSPYLQGTGVKMFTPFWSFPIKTAQMMWNNLLVNPIMKEGKMINPLMSSENAWYRYLALAGFMATAPILTSTLFGVDTSRMWGKGLFPTSIYPSWMKAVGNMYQSIGGNPGDFMDQEKANRYMVEFAGQITIPWYRWGGKIYRDMLNAERGYRTYGRDERPIVETSYVDEVFDIFGFPASKFGESLDLMKEYKDDRMKHMTLKHSYLDKAVDKMEEKDYSGAQSILKEAKEKDGIDIKPLDVQKAVEKRKDDVWIYTMNSGTKAVTGKPGFKDKFTVAREKFVPKTKPYGTKPLWSNPSPKVSGSPETSSLPEIYLEE